MLNTKTSVVILAAGKGTRMHSDLPKVLHPLAGKPMVQHVIDVAIKLGAQNIHIVYGHKGDLLKKRISNHELHWVQQVKQLGTGHAMQQASPYFSDDEDILILYGDVPMISLDTLTRLLKMKPKDGLSLVTAILDEPGYYGRIVRENGKVVGVIEYKDASDSHRKIHEINTGILVANGRDLKRWLCMIRNNNKQSEYYITDIIALAHLDCKKIETVHPRDLNEVKGVNNFLELSEIERAYQLKQAETLALSGLMVLDPSSFDLRGTLLYGRDISIASNVILEGSIELGNRVKIGIGSVLKNCEIGNDCEINPYSVLEDTVLGDNCIVGPFVHLRPGTQLDTGSHVGNFVEMKKVRLGKGSKVGHLSYLGDADIGSGVNVGAGTITCNYDGRDKHKTIIGDCVFIGSDSQLVAPLSVGKGSTIAAGTTVTRNVKENELALSRVKQKQIQGWCRPGKIIKKSPLG